MDEKKRDCSKFQAVLLNVVRSKLNLMLSELSQLQQSEQPIDFDNNQVLVKTILKKIASEEIKSAHISPEEAECFIEIFDEMSSHMEEHRFDPEGNDEQKSIYMDSPFK